MNDSCVRSAVYLNPKLRNLMVSSEEMVFIRGMMTIQQADMKEGAEQTDERGMKGERVNQRGIGSSTSRLRMIGLLIIKSPSQ